MIEQLENRIFFSVWQVSVPSAAITMGKTTDPLSGSLQVKEVYVTASTWNTAVMSAISGSAQNNKTSFKSTVGDGKDRFNAKLAYPYVLYTTTYYK